MRSMQSCGPSIDERASEVCPKGRLGGLARRKRARTMALRPNRGHCPPLFHVEQRLTWKVTEAYDGEMSDPVYAPH